MSDTTPYTTLTDGKIVLRRARTEDVQARIDAGNSAEIQHMYGGAKGVVTPVTQEQAQKWVDYHIDRPMSWFIDVDGQLTGAIFLHSHNQIDKRATLSLGLLREDHLGKGIGTRAMHLLAEHAFGTVGLHRIALRVIAYNTRAIAAYKKVGFVEEGRERQSANVGGTWHDDLMMGLLAHEYTPRMAAT